MKRYLALLLAALMLSSVAACGPASEGDDTSNDSKKPEVSDTADTSSDTTTEEVTTTYWDTLPDKNYNGAVFTWASNSSSEFPPEIAEDEEATEEQMATIERFQRVADKYNIKWNLIDAGGSGNTVSMVQQDFMVDGGNFNVANGSFVYLAAPMVTNGLATSAQKVGTIDLSKPWWSMQSETDLAIGGNTYILTGSVVKAFYDNSCIMVFNKDLIEKFNLDDPYTYLEGGKWTFDVWSQMCTAIGSKADNGGYWAWKDDGQADIAFFVAAGLSITERDSNGYLSLPSAPSEKLVSIIDKYNRFFKQPDKFDNGTYNWYWDLSNEDDNRGNFYNGNVVFDSNTAGELAGLAKDFEGNYGIMPTPIYEEGGSYITGSSMYSTDAFILVRGAKDYEMTGIITEALCSISDEILRPIQYDKAVKVRGSQDTQTMEVLDIVFNTKVYDMCTCLYPGEAFNEFITYNLVGAGDGIASDYASKVGAAQATLDQINNYIKDIEAGK